MGYIFDALNKKREQAGHTPDPDARIEVDDPGLEALIATAQQQAGWRDEPAPDPLRLADVRLDAQADPASGGASDARAGQDREIAAPLAEAMNLTDADIDTQAGFVLPDAPGRAIAHDRTLGQAATADAGGDPPGTGPAGTGPALLEPRAPRLAKGLCNRLLGRHLRGQVDDRLVAMTSPASAMSEEYRSIRTSILARNDNARHLVHTITSATPQEGKTITCVNLGLSFAELRNRSTVILECDLRLPTFAKLLNCRADRPGLIDYLHGEAAVKDILQRIEGSPLHIIPAGGRVSDEAVQLISSNRMSRLIQALRAKYDHVLIDTPPVLQLADAGILGSQSEEVLLVARMRRTPRPLVEQAVNTLTGLNARVGGIIATDNPRSRADGYKYSYGYGYRYGYGYTSDKARPAKKDKPREAA